MCKKFFQVLDKIYQRNLQFPYVYQKFVLYIHKAIYIHFENSPVLLLLYRTTIFKFITI